MNKVIKYKRYLQTVKEESIICINGKSKIRNEIDFLHNVQPLDLTSFALGWFLEHNR